MKGVKRHKLPGINSRDVNMCSIIKTTNTTACVTWESGQERKPEEFSFQGKNIYIFVSFMLCLFEMKGCSLNLHIAPCQLHLNETGRKIE